MVRIIKNSLLFILNCAFLILKISDIFLLYIRNIGPFLGMMTYITARVPISNRLGTQPYCRAKVPNYKSWLWIRPRTSDLRVFEQIFVKQDYALTGFPQNRIFKTSFSEFCQNGGTPVIIDCGANIGFSSIWFALNFPNTVVYAIEPDLENFVMLKKNTKGIKNVVPIHAGVWDHETELTIQNKNVESWAVQLSEGKSSNQNGVIQSITLSNLIKINNHKNDDLWIVKIDIEGAETELFRSNTEWLDEVRLIMIELHDWMIPWKGSSVNFFNSVTRVRREYLFRRKTMFCFINK